MIDPRNPPYIVVSVLKGPSTNPRKHQNRESAQSEARRLAIENPDDTFLIFRAIAAVEAPRIINTEFEDPEDQPILKRLRPRPQAAGRGRRREPRRAKQDQDLMGEA